MQGNCLTKWQDTVASLEKVSEKIEPCMSIFRSTGLGEPRTLLRKFMFSNAPNLHDLELIQCVNAGDAVASEKKYVRHFLLKTFRKNAPHPTHTVLSDDMYDLVMPFTDNTASTRDNLPQWISERTFQDTVPAS